MRHLMSPLDFSVEELDELLKLAQALWDSLPQAPVLLQKEKVYLIQSVQSPATQISVQ